jgi:hypothetical protein
MLFAVTIVLFAESSTAKSMANVMSIIVGFAIASTVARSIGIVRRLIPAPQLAKTWGTLLPTKSGMPSVWHLI